MTYEAQSEMWDAIAGVEARDTRKRLFVQGIETDDGHAIDVLRIAGTRIYKVRVDGVELPGWHDWTIDAINAGRAAVKS